jgi:cell division protein FtsZ
MSFTIEERQYSTLHDQEAVANIKVIGVGGGGGNMVNHMISQGIDKIDLIAANTDLQALNKSKAPTKLQLGVKLTKGLGAGMKPAVGKEAALESYEEISNTLDGADIVFVSSGLGGGTGTGAAAVVAKAAKEQGALTIAVVTKPFKWEGKKRTTLALAGLEELKANCDSIVVIPNDRLLEITDKKLGMKDSFALVDNILYQAVNGMSGVILSYGDSDINVDFADVQTVMQHRGLALMGIGDSQGDNAAEEALKTAIESPLLDNMSLDGAQGVLIHFTLHPDYPLALIADAMEHIEESASMNAEVIFGTTSTDEIEPDRVKLTIVATGFEHEEVLAEAEKPKVHQPKAHKVIDELKEEKVVEPEKREESKILELDLSNLDEFDIPPMLR